MKLIKIITISFCIIIMLSANVLALSEWLETAKDWEVDGEANTGTTMDTEDLNSASGKVYNIFLVAATAVAVIVGSFLGIKYMCAGISEKVEVKKSLFPYIVSCIVVFGSMGIWKLGVTIIGQI